MEMTPENTPVEPEMDETGQESAPTPSKEGYEICVYVSPEGYRVEGPLPLEAKPQGEAPEQDAASPDLTDALKQVVAIIKENPFGEDAQAQMDAGYQSTAHG